MSNALSNVIGFMRAIVYIQQQPQDRAFNDAIAFDLLLNADISMIMFNSNVYLRRSVERLNSLLRQRTPLTQDELTFLRNLLRAAIQRDRLLTLLYFIDGEESQNRFLRSLEASILLDEFMRSPSLSLIEYLERIPDRWDSLFDLNINDGNSEMRSRRLFVIRGWMDDHDTDFVRPEEIGMPGKKFLKKYALYKKLVELLNVESL